LGIAGGKKPILNNGKWLVVIIGLLSFGYVWKYEGKEVKTMENQELAEKYCPVIVQGEGIKPEPEAIFYRMAEEDGHILIAYHIVWAYEKDSGRGFWKVWNRLFYTGGLHLQKVIFGPGDVEAIELKIDKKSGRIIRIRYETARVRKSGKIKHIPLVVEQDQIPPALPLYFEVISWNHLFKLIDPGQAKGKKIYQLKPKYFTDQLWEHYRMTKKHQGPLSQDRAHFGWETRGKE